VSAIMEMINNGDALLFIHVNDLDAFQGMDPERVGSMQKSHSQNMGV
jgi:hypothetical protein